MKYFLIVYSIYLAFMSLLTFTAYGADKRKAKKGVRRTPEKTLLLLSLAGGAFGGFAAMQVFRHKTRGEHWYFTAVNLLGILCHAALLAFLLFRMI